ncbi:hypothetical protein SAMN05428945_4924 [Streptomyces sp. 2224.1]|nr:hypothetical protein SAMN05428945_4924 [Streptomyces sp. 2224.1]
MRARRRNSTERAENLEFRERPEATLRTCKNGKFPLTFRLFPFDFDSCRGVAWGVVQLDGWMTDQRVKEAR